MFRLNRVNGASYYTVSSFEETGLVRHCITTREGGVSGGCYSSMNLRFHCDDRRENVLENYKRAAENVGMDYRRLVISHQTHDDVVRAVSETDAGNGIMFENRFKSADALITAERNLPLVTLYADCTPVLMLDKRQGVIASVHSGWKGTVKRIAAKTAHRMIFDYGSRHEDILCAIGPSIQVCHFEVGDDVAEIFINEFGEDTVLKIGDRYHANMQRAIVKQLTEAGIPEANIDDCGICTYCESELLFSHRKTKGRRGNFGAFIELV
ncbi:MAG TPA: peptidoglycan editing factor PgeF [Candidatus Ornithomonoglobus merdipullorum]|uniref:Purine nucleoside phosphorylase n=1 Tax=Candidatus Ornithomonoglobus merdipullorum TaxID=2840895 RepID=A0A9D1MD49_9FIRM|nr:peptidoglycan editing factor PgeF [Candidatus Ornithomonoglobus merdipullorum]